LKGISKKLRQLDRHVDLGNPDSVLRYIHARKNVNTKSLFVNAYNHYAEYYKLQWEKPIFRKSETPVKVPLEENLDYIIGSTKSLKRKVAFGILKDSGIRPIELHNLTLDNIDLEQGIIYVRSAKHGTPRSLKLKTQTLANLKHLIGRMNPDKDSRIFACSERLSKNWRLERLRAYAETGNSELLKIRLYDLRHFYATKLYHNTQDILRVKVNLGHRSIQNTLRYTHLVDFKDDEFNSASAKTVEEIRKLVDSGFEFVTEVDGVQIFRKRK